MKTGGGVGGSYALPTKRGWRGLVVAVLGLVILSMLVPLVFLLGLHNGFRSAGYVTVDQRSALNKFESYDPNPKEHDNSRSQSKEDQLMRVDDLMRRLKPSLPKDIVGSFVKEFENLTVSREPMKVSTEVKDDGHVSSEVLKPLPDTNNTRFDNAFEVTKYVKGVIDDGSEKLCQLGFGTYCLWRKEYKEEMKDSTVKKLKDQLFVARAYYPSIAKVPVQEKLSHELKQNIQDFEHILSETTSDADLPIHIEKKQKKMADAITKAKSFPVDCNNVDKKLRQILDLTEDEADFHMKQSAFLYQLAVQTMPKSLHCLSMRLTVEYFKSISLDKELLLADKYFNPAFHHYVIFSENVLASSVVINSTIVHAKESGKQVFHLLTNGQSYFAMKLWFYRNIYKEATIRVVNIEEIKIDSHDRTTLLDLSLPEEFRVSFLDVERSPATQMRTEYMSVFGQSHFLLPEIFHNLKKVVVLDDDIVVQKDLSPLWSLDLEGKVNGAVQLCSVRLGQLENYLAGNSFAKSSCAWMSGLNIIDLEKWRERNLTEIYRKLLQDQLSMGEASRRAGALPVNLLAFQDLIYALDSTWVLSGLGHDYEIDGQDIEKAAVLHYSGNMKPWLDLGIPRYKGHWKKFMKREDRFLSECNVNP